MNHGIVCFEGSGIGSRLWWTAMNRGQFIAMYALRSFADGGTRRANPWRESFVPSESGSLLLGGDEYARYEPTYDSQFAGMCLATYNRFPAVMVPRDATDADALVTLTAFDAIAPDLRYRLFDYPGDRRKYADRRLGELIQAVPVRCEWAYLFSFFYPRPVTALVSADRAYLDAFEAVDDDRYYFKVVERW